jgi:polyisoprenoid-binding protein YceI
MNNIKSIMVSVFVVVFALYSTAQTKKIDISKSSLNWVGKKVTGEHSGTIAFKSGTLEFKEKALTGGTLIVDMASLTATDLKGDDLQDLNGHLKADDFFGTDKFPTATLIFKSISAKGNGSYTITADLTIKGITKATIFDLKVKGDLATTSLKVDRTKYDIKYGSKSFFDGIGDKAIYDDFDLKVSLKI